MNLHMEALDLESSYAKFYITANGNWDKAYLKDLDISCFQSDAPGNLEIR